MHQNCRYQSPRVEKVIEDLQLPEEITQQPHRNTGMTEIEYRLAWARTSLKIYGLITNSSRGIWSLTAQGQNVPSVDGREVARYVVRLGQQRKASAGQPISDVVEPSEELEEAIDETAIWREELLQVLLEMDPSAFERLCQRLLRESGFTEVEVTGRPGDEGIDGQGIIRIGGLISFPVVFQCKRYKSNVGPGVVRDFRGSMMGRADKGLIITTSNFTREARREATRDGAPPIDLIGSELLMDKLKELELGVKSEMVEEVKVDAKWFKTL